MPKTSLDEARLQAELIRKAVENARFRLEHETLVVTVSAGVAEITPPGDVASLIQRTDEAMYAAKQAGRNCVFLHDGTRLRPSRTDQAVEPPVPLPTPKLAEPPVAQTPAPARVPNVTRTAKPETEQDSDSFSVDPDSIDLDLLGNLNNKTMFCQHVHRRIAEFNRGGATFSTILLGVDNYNQLIADHGLATAELALGVVAQAIRDAVRVMDLVAKYDDRTFGLILPEAQLRNAICVGERLRKEVHRTGVMIDDEPVRFTISLGIVEVADGDEMATHLERAAAQLRLATSRGGNRTGFAASA
jgi:diguanylate cyclase (GGDEF)-like protein